MASVRSPGISEVIFFFSSCFTGSMTLTVPPISDETQTSEASRLNSAKRGRASTSTLATIRRVSVSMKCAILVVSDVATRICLKREEQHHQRDRYRQVHRREDDQSRPETARHRIDQGRK